MPAIRSDDPRDWSTLARYIPRALGRRAPPLCSLMLRLMEVVERLAWHQLNHIQVLDKKTAAQWEIFPCVLKCIVDEVVIICQHRKADKGSSKSSATVARGVQTDIRKVGEREKFEPKVIVSCSGSDSTDSLELRFEGDVQHHSSTIAEDTPREALPRVTRGTNTVRSARQSLPAGSQADLPCRRCHRRFSQTRKPCRSVGVSSILPTRSVGVAAFAPVVDRGIHPIHGGESFDSSTQTSDVSIEPIVEGNTSQMPRGGSAALTQEGESGHFTLHYSVSRAMQRVPSEEADLTGERQTPENSVDIANNDEILLGMVSGRAPLPSHRQEGELSVALPRAEGGSSSYDRVDPCQRATTAELIPTSEPLTSSETERSHWLPMQEGELDEVGIPREKSDSPIVSNGSGRRRSSSRGGHSPRLIAASSPSPEVPIEGSQSEGSNEQTVDKYTKMVTTWVSGLWTDAPAKPMRKSFEESGSLTFKAGTDATGVTQITSAVSRYISTTREGDEEEPTGSVPRIEEAIVLPNSISAFHRKREKSQERSSLNPP